MGSETGQAQRELPQLKVMLDPQRMLPYFQSTLRSAPPSEWRIAACSPSQLHFRPGARTSLLYALKLEEPGTGGSAQQWVTATTYPGKRARRLYHKLIQEVAERPVAAPLTPAVAYIDDLSLLIHLFPIDHHLHALTALLSCQAPELTRLYCTQMGDGDWQIVDCRTEVLRYRPYRCATLEHRVKALDQHSREQRSRRFFLKLQRGEEGEAVFRTLNQLDRFARDNRSRLQTLRPVAYVPELQTLVLPQAPGRALPELLLTGASTSAPESSLKSALVDTAEALAELHLQPWPVDLQRSHIMEPTRRIAAFIGGVCPEFEPAVRAVVAALERVQPPLLCRPTHMDFKADHVFVDPRGITVIDTDNIAQGDPVTDPAKFMASLQYLAAKGMFSAALARWAGEAFLEAYLARVPGAWQERLPFNHAREALLMAMKCLQHRELPDWHVWTGRFLDDALSAVRNR